MFDKKLKISIVIATFNSEHTIERALDSVVSQTFDNWECLVMDGASKDDTVRIALKYAEEDSRIRVFSEPDRGVYDAFNKGWKASRGEFIYYLGSDDELLTGGLEALVAHSDDADYIYGGAVLRYKSGKTKVQRARLIEDAAPFSSGACHQGVIMKRSLIERLGGFNMKYRIIADYDLIMRGFYDNMRTRRVDALIAIYTLGGMSSDNLNALFEGYQIQKSLGVGWYKRTVHFVKKYIKICLLKIKHLFD